MNDERFQKSKHNTSNSNSNKNISTSNKFNKKCNNLLKSEYYLAEAAKVSLKNVLNGTKKETIVAAAKLLNATKAFHFSPPPPPPPQPAPSTPASLAQQRKNLKSFINFENSTAVAVAAGREQPSGQKLQQSVAVVNNGLSSLSTKATADSKKTTTKIGSMAAIASTPILHVGGGGAIDAGLKMATDCEVIDYTLNNLKNNNNNTNNNNNNNNNNGRNNFDSRNTDHDRQQYGGGNVYGGRLQFFKDGKFILELARSKDGERTGWVSVPRKPMRPPSATSSTITPTSATSLVAYPKNESSTSLSFSDDNSSIQSSPWQRDHCWKQATPKRHVSKEMCLYFVRPNVRQLTQAALKVARRKRRQPLNKLTLTLAVKLFERLDINVEENVAKKSSSTETETATARLNTEEISPKDLNSNSLEQSADNQTNKMEVNEENICDVTDIVKSNTTNTTKTDNNEHMEKDNVELNSNETSELKEHKEVETTTEVQVDDDNDNDNENDNKNMDKENNIGMEAGTASENKVVKKANVKRKRLEIFKERAKLDTIVQKLSQRALRETEQQLKLATTMTAEMTGNGLAKKCFPAPAATNRLVDFHHQHVSPRKRILRELEKVTLEDGGAKRSRAKTANNNFSLSATNSCIQTKLPATTAMDTPNEKTTTTTVTEANTTPATATRLYSSYSIHSLLSGSSSSSSSSSSSNKKPTISYDKQVNQHQHVDSYQRNLMLSSPKSPEHGKLYKKRSPPYTMENSHHHHQHQQQQQHHMQQQQHHLAEHHQGFHSPYMLSPKYMSRPNTVSSSDVVTTTNTINNIPKNVSTPSNTYTSQHTTTNASAFTSSTAGAVNLLSPSTATVDSTPRTVPKKTPSIRRQFASPTSVTAASPPATATTPLNENDIYMQHNSLQQQQHWPQVPVSGAPTMHAPLHFYMYPPAPPTANGSSANDAAAVAAAAAAAYIPYYHPYFSTLAALRQNPLWLHHYAGQQHAAIATRLSPPTYAGHSNNFLAATANPPGIPSYMPSPNSRANNNNMLGNNKLYAASGMNNKLPTTATINTVSNKQQQQQQHRIPTPTSTSTMSSASSSSHGVGSYKSGSIKDEPSSGMY